MCALADGAGNANMAAKKVLDLFSKLYTETEKSAPLDLLDETTWRRWVKILDSSLLGGSQSTFVGLSIGERVAVGCAVGDSRFYKLNRDGKLTIVTAESKKARLGSGQAEPCTFRIDPLQSGDILLLLSDGAYTPLDMARLQREAVTAAVRHFSDVPTALVTAAGKHGFADDATCVAVRVR
jgi:serine/threonine protein phosphatase PrpC